MPVPNIPTTEEIRDNIITDVENTLSQTVPLLPKSFVRVLAGALAGVITLCYKFGSWIYLQIFPQTSDIESLENQGGIVSTTIKQATAAVLLLDATGTDPTVIPAGFKWISSSQVQFITNADVTISGGVAAVTVTAVEFGEIGNLIPGEEVQAVNPAVGIDNLAVVNSILIEGEDQEGTEDYRSRVLDRYQRKPQGGAEVDYIIWARQVPDITRAFAFLGIPGFVNVYPLTDNDPSRIPSGAKLTEVADYINDPSRKPLTATVNVLAITELDIDVTLNSFLPNDPTIITNSEQAIRDYIFEREPKQFEDQSDVKNVISSAEITSVVVAVGGQSFTVVLNVEGTPETNFTLAENEIALADQVVINV